MIGRGIWKESEVAAASSTWFAVAEMLKDARSVVEGTSQTIPIDSARDFLDRWEESGRTGQPFEFERTLNGRLIQSVLVPVRIGTNEETRWVGVNIDITDRARAEVKRQAIQRLHESTLEASGIGTWSMHSENAVVTLSQSARMMFGLPLEGNVMFSEWVATVVPEQRNRIPELIESSTVSSTPAVSLETLSGRRLRLACSGEAGALFGTAEDLDQRAKTIVESYRTTGAHVWLYDRQLRLVASSASASDAELNEDIRLLMKKALETGQRQTNRTTDGEVVVVDFWQSGIVVERRKAAPPESPLSTVLTTEEMRKLGPLGSSNWLDSVPGRDQALLALQWNSALSTGIDFEIDFPLRNGSIQRVKAKRMEGMDGWALESIEILPEPEIEPSVRDALDHLRFSIANLHATPQILLDQAGENLKSSERRALVTHIEAVAELNRSMDRLRLWGDLSDAEPHRQVVDVMSLIESDPEMAIMKSRVLHVTGRPVHADPRLLRIGLREILRNCIQFAGDGAISITTSADMITVTDSGPGFPTEILTERPMPLRRGRIADRIPGDGLGLSIASRIARGHGGYLSLANEPTGGRVELYFGPHA